MADRLKLSISHLVDLGFDADAGLIRWGMQERTRIKSEQDKLKEDLEQVNTLMGGLMNTHNIQSINDPLIGTMTLKHGVSKSLNRTKLTNSMLGHGIDAEVINLILEEGGTITEYDTVEFRGVKSE